MSLTSADHSSYKGNGKKPKAKGYSGLVSTENFILAIMLMAVAYNGILAALFAHGFPISSAVPAVVEVTLLLCSALIILSQGMAKSSIFPVSLSYFVIVISIVISVKDNQLYVVPVRNFLIISVFTILGGLCSFQTLKRVFILSSVIVILSLIFEVMWLDSYVSFFEPAKYLSLTRGMSESEYSGGLSAGTIAFKGRFSLGLYSGPRTSSIFLEQVSINCFAIVLALYLLTFVSNLRKSEIILHVGAIFFILATNNARMALIVSVIFIPGYFVFSKIPKYTNIILMPLIISSLFITFALIPTTGGDDLLGRMTTTYELLNSISVDSLMLGSVSGTAKSFDSGYGFIIFSTTIFGLIFLWLYTALIVPQNDNRSKRCAWGLSVYIGIWLLVGGTGTFSMKTAPLLWLIVGFVRHQSLSLSKNSGVEIARPDYSTYRDAMKMSSSVGPRTEMGLEI